jgi:2-C-methyl-D-erythritol 4-phosphate cytidylyltransferase
MSPSSPAALPPDVGVLLPAAGRGERAGSGEPKQFRAIAGVPMLLRAVRPFAQHARVRQIVIALPAECAPRPPAWLADLIGERLRLVAGGATRAESVARALATLDPQCQLVLVHDAARPFVSTDTIDAVIDAAGSGSGAVAAIPVGDTLKRVSGLGGVIAETVDRNGLWRAQTPQGFPRAMLEAAYAGRAGLPDSTDDAQLVERLGHAVRVVPDRATNIKVTTADDFTLAEALARR